MIRLYTRGDHKGRPLPFSPFFFPPTPPFKGTQEAGYFKNRKPSRRLPFSLPLFFSSPFFLDPFRANGRLQPGREIRKNDSTCLTPPTPFLPLFPSPPPQGDFPYGQREAGQTNRPVEVKLEPGTRCPLPPPPPFPPFFFYQVFFCPRYGDLMDVGLVALMSTRLLLIFRKGPSIGTSAIFSPLCRRL